VTVTVEMVGNRIWVTAPYAVSRLGAAVPGSYFSDKPHAHWTAPLNLDTCRLLREHFGAELKIGPRLTAWAREAVEQEAHLTALGATETAELHLVPSRAPQMAVAMKSRPYQPVAARFVADGKRVLLADTPGLGKTLEALAGIVESGAPGPYLIVAPKTVCDVVWGREILRWVPGAGVWVLPEGKAKRDEMLTDFHIHWEATGAAKDFLVVHPQAMQTRAWWDCRECGESTPVKAFKELSCGHDTRQAPRRVEHNFPQIFAVEWGAVVADEADQCLLRKTGTPTQTRLGMEMIRDCVREDGLRIAATGTPFRGRPHLLWGTLNWLRPEHYRGFWQWVETHYEVTTGYGGTRVLGGLKREDLLYKSLGGIMLRRTKEEVAPDLPPKLYMDNRLPEETAKGLPIGVWLEFDHAKQERAYRQMAAESLADLEGRELDAIGALAELTRLQQLASSYLAPSGKPRPPSNKLNWLVQHLKEIGYYDKDPQCKVVIVSRFTSLLDMFAEELAVPYVQITGQVTGAKRTQAVDTFNSPSWDGVCFLNTKAGGVGITLDAADEMVFLDRTHVPDDQEQAEERINNRRPEEKVLQRRYYYLGTKGTIDEAIAQVNVNRETNSRTILDSRRGVTTWAIKALGGMA
jgi:hypothetical protein